MPEGCHSALNRDPMGEGKRNATFRDAICVYRSNRSYIVVPFFLLLIEVYTDLPNNDDDNKNAPPEKSIRSTLQC